MVKFNGAVEVDMSAELEAQNVANEKKVKVVKGCSAEKCEMYDGECEICGAKKGKATTFVSVKNEQEEINGQLDKMSAVLEAHEEKKMPAGMYACTACNHIGWYKNAIMIGGLIYGPVCGKKIKAAKI